MKNKGELIFVILVFLLSSLQAESTTPGCEACHFIVTEARKSMPRRPFDFVLSQIGLQYCEKKHIQDKTVCKGAITEMIDPIINSLWTKAIDPHEICHKLYLCPKEYFKRNITA